MINVKEGQFQQCSLHSSIVKQLSTGNSFQLTKQLLVHREYYLEVLKRLMARIRRIQPEYRDPETRRNNKETYLHVNDLAGATAW